MEPRITNAWAGRDTGPDGRPETVLVLESTVAPRDVAVSLRGRELAVEVLGCDLNMPEDTIPVYDGLVREVSVRRAAPGRVRCLAALDHPTGWRVRSAAGLPWRTLVCLDRTPVHRLLAGRVIVIDPGHGGRDEGARGPINLREKNVVLDIARRLAALLNEAGAAPVLTRSADEDVDAAARWRPPEGAACLVSIHTGHGPDPATRGTRTLYAGPQPASRRLAGCIHAALLDKMKLGDRGLRPARPGGARGGPSAALGLPPHQPPIPAAVVEVVCIRNPVEEALLRSAVFKHRLAQAVWNGLKDYMAGAPPAMTTGRGGAGAASEARAAVPPAPTGR